MPDDLDYAWLGWLIEHPDEWTPADLATAKASLPTRSEPSTNRIRRTRGHEGKQAVVDALESAIQEYRGRDAL
jgi:hypothetical protein